MTYAELKEIMDRNMIMECEVNNAIDFVLELLEFQASEIKRNEPYATKTIKRLEDAAYEVYNLEDYICDLEE